MIKKFIGMCLFVAVMAFTLNLNVEANSLNTTSTSKLGHAKQTGVVIYDQQTLAEKGKVDSSNIGDVFYIKQELNHNNQKYYLISTRPSASTGVLGWVKSNDLNVHVHKTVARSANDIYINGFGSAFDKAWGGKNNLVYSDTNPFKMTQLKVDLVETVGNNTWYRGVLDGKRVFLHENHVSRKKISSTSKLGHIRYAGVPVYEKNSLNLLRTLNDDDLNKVYYIKQELLMESNNSSYNELYYLISTSPSATSGVIGWVKATNLSTHEHKTVGTSASGLYVNGNSSAYSKAWGGEKDIVFSDLSSKKLKEFKVDLVETVGGNTWYRGMLDGERVFIHQNHLSQKEVSSTSKLGKTNQDNVPVYNKYTLELKHHLTGNNLNKVYYVKEKALLKSNNSYYNSNYYLLTLGPSASSGIVGWVSEEYLDLHNHSTVGLKSDPLYFTGAGSAYEKAWGGGSDIVVQDLTPYKGERFEVVLVERVGNNVWYRGKLNNQLVFLHENWLSARVIDYISQSKSLNDVLNIQMTKSPQTDKYLRDPAYVHESTVKKTSNQYTINGSGVALRTSPDTSVSNNIYARVNDSTPVEIIESVNGSLYQGSTKWYKIFYNDTILNKRVELYVHSLLVSDSTNSSLETIVNANVRSGTSNSAHIYGSINKGKKLRILDTVSGSTVSGSNTWYQIPYGTWRLPTREDTEKYLNPEKQDIFQFLILSRSANAGANDLNKLLVSKGVLENKGQSYVNASKKYNVNEAYLVSHSILETGNGKSTLAKGVKVGLNNKKEPVLVTSTNSKALTNIKTVYNVYGIGAVDSNPLTEGAKYAYRNGWDTVEKAIEEGAQFVSLNYFERNQRTLYEMRWNPQNPGTHQYATDIGWAAKQVTMIKNIYENVLPNLDRYFRMPKYN